ncbi:hypothetical protein IMCC20628_02333 [Hoeflea sp. IMCC20628]|uniref:hypothetical protein n=1 Tax=Hoeflea sp. IMCC20628 TaxID=1620421 RepID=UPI00063AED76|nr:hypothetical protein [Hoeflea sp. IMCC20628]AKI01032.1 hypothetical protein IMCC20628_02333 [Hoeflea sp. IMCC20628]
MPRFNVSVLMNAAALTLALTPLAQAQSANPAWLDQLSEQLAIEKDCAVDYFLNMKEGELAGRLTFEARAQCADGRQFDGSLTEPEEKYTISECGTQVC